MKDLQTYYKLGSVFAGVIWLLAGVCSIFDSLATDIISVLLFLIATIIAAVKMRWARNSETDEMGEYHLLRAKAYALDIIYILVFALAGMQFIKISTGWSIYIDVHTFSLFVLGAAELVIGLKFLDLEKNGD